MCLPAYVCVLFIFFVKTFNKIGCCLFDNFCIFSFYFSFCVGDIIFEMRKSFWSEKVFFYLSEWVAAREFFLKVRYGYFLRRVFVLILQFYDNKSTLSSIYRQNRLFFFLLDIFSLEFWIFFYLFIDLMLKCWWGLKNERHWVLIYLFIVMEFITLKCTWGAWDWRL